MAGVHDISSLGQGRAPRARSFLYVLFFSLVMLSYIYLYLYSFAGLAYLCVVCSVPLTRFVPMMECTPRVTFRSTPSEDLLLVHFHVQVLYFEMVTLLPSCSVICRRFPRG